MVACEKHETANTVLIDQGAAYTALSRTKSCVKLHLLNLNYEHIKINIAALSEMRIMKEHAVFTWQHPIAENSGNNIALSNLEHEMLIWSNTLQILQ